MSVGNGGEYVFVTRGEREGRGERVVFALRRICVREGLPFFADAAFYFISIFF